MMTLKVKGFTNDADVDFTITGTTDEEKALIRSLRGREVELIVSDATGATTTPMLIFRAMGPELE